MTKERYEELMREVNPRPLEAYEWFQGWHFCCEWDGLLVGPGMGELRCCTCECAKHVPRPPEEPTDPTFVF